MSKKIAFKFFWKNFTALYKTVPHDLLIKVLSEIINFVFKSKTRSCINFSKASVCWTLKGCVRRYFTKKTLTVAISFFITKCYLTIRNLVFKLEIGIPMGIGPAAYQENLFLYFFKSKYIQQPISNGSSRAYKFVGTSRFIDDFSTINLFHTNISTPNNKD